MLVSPGQYLWAVRERLKIDVQQVEEASLVIASEETNDRFFVSRRSLAAIENNESMPSFYKLYTLCAIYGLSLNDVLSVYGVPRSERRMQLRRTGPNERIRGLDLLIESIVKAPKRTYEMTAGRILADIQREYSVPVSNEPKSKPLLSGIVSTSSFWKAIIVAGLTQRLRSTSRRSTPGA
jgi:transcriptional regulator with XRE-family HTH domain